MSTKEEEVYHGLKFKTIAEAAQEALRDVNVERSDEQNGLYCSWNGVNKGMGKYWRFNHITLLAASSGHGKSYAINQLHDKFTDFDDMSDLSNRAFKGKLVVIHFGLEMDASDEVIRNISRNMQKSHNYLLSSEYNDLSSTYNKITDAELSEIERKIQKLGERPIYYVENTGTTAQMLWTVKKIQDMHPGCRLVVSLDHTLLVKRSDSERNDGDLIAAVGSFALILRRHFKAMVIMLGQLNQNIKSIERAAPQFHYPMDSDIYHGSQVNWVCDNIWIFPHRPELLNIEKYGLNKLPTKGLIVASCVKSRKGRLGDIYLKNALEQGKFVELTVDDL